MSNTVLNNMMQREQRKQQQRKKRIKVVKSVCFLTVVLIIFGVQFSYRPQYAETDGLRGSVQHKHTDDAKAQSPSGSAASNAAKKILEPVEKVKVPEAPVMEEKEEEVEPNELIATEGKNEDSAGKYAKKEIKKEDHYDICVVGAGLSGAVIAERYATQLDKTVLVMEKRDHIGGNCFDYVDDETGIRVSKYGAHLFHTKYERVWDYIQQFSDWTKYEHEVLGHINGTHVPIPVNIDTVNALFGLNIKDSKQMDEWLAKEQVKYDHEPKDSEEMAMSRVGKRLYEMIFKPYTFKQWAKWPAELGPEVTARIPVRNNHDGRYFDDPHQALPTNGYTAIFDKLFEHENIKVSLNTDYFEERESLNCDRIYFTGPIDAYFAHLGWDKLEYRSLDFERKVVKDVDYFQPASVVNHPSSDVDFTRIVEYKHLLKQKSKDTVVFYERSKDGGEPYYPVPNKKNKDLFQKYKDMAAKEPNVTFVGRLANYKYFNMDQTIKNALELFDKDTGVKPAEKEEEKTTGKKYAKKEIKKDDHYDICVVGAGLSGAVIAERYATQLDKTVLVMEKRDHIGGNCYDYIDDETGIRVSKYGAHLFHTKYDRVWEYIQRFSDWTKYEHEVLGHINGTHVPIPVNINTVNALFGLNIKDSKQMDEWLAKEQVKYDHEPKDSEEMAMSRVGKRLYEMIFKPYTFKQWAKWPAELGPEVTARIPVRNNHDGRYFDDPHQALPTNGYTAIFDKLFEHENIKVSLNTDYFEERESLNCGRIYFTGPIDAYFAHLGWDKLEYRSLDFERKVVKDVDYFQPASVVNHPSSDVDFTRIVEYKHLLKQKSKDTVVFYERSKDGGEPYYPVPNKKNKDLFQKYKDMAAKEPNVTFVGRLANYKYFNMDQTIKNALELFDEDTGAKAGSAPA